MSKDKPVPHVHAEVIKENTHRFLYIPETGQLVWADNYGPRARKGVVIGSIDSSGYRQVKLSKKSVLVHRIIWLMFNGSYPEQIDHINRIRTDNRIENLRAATNTTNQHNLSIRIDNKTGVTGVNMVYEKYQARIGVNGRRIYLGIFDSLSEAADAYKNAKEKYHE